MTGSSVEIGNVEREGDHKGEIYGGIFPADNKPIWFSPLASKVMNHFEAAAWARHTGGRLPNKVQGEYLSSIKDKGAFKSLFNSGSSSSGYFWLAEYDGFYRTAGVQWFADGRQGNMMRHDELNTLSVRR